MVHLYRGYCGPYRISSFLSSACLLRRISQQNQHLHCNQLIVLTEEEVQTIIAITLKILNNTLDAISMQLTLMMRVRCRLMHSISNVRFGIARKMRCIGIPMAELHCYLSENSTPSRSDWEFHTQWHEEFCQ